jgi:hypothetical protein
MWSKQHNGKVSLERVTVGDLVEITYTEALAVSVDKPGRQ